LGGRGRKDPRETVSRKGRIVVQTTPSTVVITLPIHPHFGREAQVWRGPYRRHGVGEVVDVELPDGIRRQLPIGWTDRLPVRRCPVIGSSLVLFDAGRLLEQIRFLDALAEKLAHSSSPTEGGYPDTTCSSTKPGVPSASARGSAVAEPEATRSRGAVDGADDPPSPDQKGGRS
jgi:hypothetical protein